MTSSMLPRSPSLVGTQKKGGRKSKDSDDFYGFLGIGHYLISPNVYTY
jgi:hypothetical protein